MLLARKGIEDPEPTLTKRKRLFVALHQKQARDRCANGVLAFIQEAMAPVRYVQNRSLFEGRRNALNVALALAGYHLGEDGGFRSAEKARTLADAEARANRLSKHLVDRRVHPLVLQFSKAELL